jgi:hypothetical protein
MGGHGLMLVEALSSRWGIYAGTTQVWFELDTRRTDPERSELGLGESHVPTRAHARGHAAPIAS